MKPELIVILASFLPGLYEAEHLDKEDQGE